MEYKEIEQAIFLNRPNRFVAEVDLEGEIVRVHVKNTGRCKELLVPGCRVILSKGDNPKRKTPYDLVAVYRPDGMFFNMDSQAPNAAVGEWLRSLDYFDEVRPEFTIGGSRIDFRMTRGDQVYLLEVKGCTLVKEDGKGYFPDAPTERGLKHIRELIRLTEEGYRCSLAFVIQTEGVNKVYPNVETHPAFGQALAKAKEAGLVIRHMPCRVEEKGLWIREDVSWFE